MVGTSFPASLDLSAVGFFSGREKDGLGVGGENVVSAEVAAGVAVVAMSEKAGASSWGTS